MFPDLTLGAIEDHANIILAVEKLNVVKDITLAAVRFRETQELAIPVDFSLPAGRKVALDPRAVE